MKHIISKLAALMLIGVLVTSVGATPALADWDKTNYPAIQGTISITEETDLSLVKNYLVGLYDPDDNDLSINIAG